MIHTMREKEPKSISSTLNELNEGRIFHGDPVTGVSADITGKLSTEPLEEEPMGGHPATELEEPETETGEKESSRSSHIYGSREEAECAAEQAEREIAKLSSAGSRC